jgi:hypothetical protein
MAKEEVQKKKQRPTNFTHKTKHRVTRAPLKKPCQLYYIISYYDLFKMINLNAKIYLDP